MTKVECLRNSALVKEKWSLIVSGFDCKSIKVRSSSLYVKNKLYGKKVSNDQFQLISSVDDQILTLIPTQTDHAIKPEVYIDKSTPYIDDYITPATPSCNSIKSPSQNVNLSPDLVSDRAAITNSDSTFQSCSDVASHNADCLGPSFKMCYLNTHSLTNKLSHFQIFVLSSPYSIFCLSETWLMHNIYGKEIISSGYNIYHKDRNSRGGGVLIALRNSIPSFLMPLPKNLEVVTINICSKTPIILCILYSPLNSTIEYQLRLIKYLHTLTQSPSRTIIVGDFNAPEINWSSLTGGISFSKALCDLIFANSNLAQLMHSPTHIKGNILDLVLTNSKETIDNVTIIHEISQPSATDNYII